MYPDKYFVTRCVVDPPGVYQCQAIPNGLKTVIRDVVVTGVESKVPPLEAVLKQPLCKRERHAAPALRRFDCAHPSG